MVAPTFLNVGNKDGKFTLADLTTAGLAECWGDVNIQLLDEQGKTVKDGKGKAIRYIWQDNEDFDEVGWYDGDDNKVEASDVSFNAGQGLWVAGIADSSLQGAGEVNKSDVVVNLRAGMTPTGNPFPTTIKLSDIVPSGYDEGECWGDINIQLLDAQGKTVKDNKGKAIRYIWQDNEDFEEAGWYDGDDNKLDSDSITFTAGQGMWVAGVADTVLTFSAPTF